MRLIAAAAIALLFVMPAQAEAQEGTKWEGVDWYRVTHVEFHNGKAGDARRLIEEHFMKATEKAGTDGPAMLLWHETGEWDVTVLWHMKGGPADLEWRRSPDNVKWWQAFSDQEGGEEEAEKMMAEYSSLVARSTSSIARSM